ncbi:MAG TPA: PadR family transcriptional regulator [Lachnospiraceae bacterium]|nr:PadR family transcriptional regulator [Lachnospiraceae bacterium]
MANDKRMDCVILGLLSHEPLTGYDIKKRIDESLSFFWNGSYGSIYPTLSKLTESGYVIKNEANDNGRDKLMYSITDAGKDVLLKWLKGPVIKDELRYETLLKLFFGGELGKQGTLEHIKRFEDKIKLELCTLQMYEENLRRVLDEADHKYYLLTVMFGIETYKGYLKWCDNARKLLEE